MSWNALAARRAIREAGGLERVAEASGLALATVKRLRHGGKVGPTFETAERFAVATGRPLDAFRKGGA